MLKNRKRVLKYISESEAAPDAVCQLSPLIPDWYKQTPKWVDNVMRVFPKTNKTFKLCSPFLDSFITGYALTLPADVLVSLSPELQLTWNGTFKVVNQRLDSNNKNIPVPAGHLPHEYVWVLPSAIKIPAGYSVLITHPLNRHDLPFTSLSAVIDGEFTMSSYGNLPFFLKEGFEGIIPKGTPIAQIVPFKRESWILEKDSNLIDQSRINSRKSDSVIFGWYKKNIWKKKSYT